MSLTMQGVSHAYGDRRVLSGVSLALRDGEVVGLVGANGAGKSTLLRVAVGIEAASAGTIVLEGASIASLSRREIAKRVAYVPQQFHVDFGLRVREMVALGRIAHEDALGRDPDRDAAIDDALRAVRVEALADRDVRTLSGGEMRRVILARALAQRAKLMVLDEPTASLDLGHAADVMELLSRQARAGKAVLVAIHDLELAARTCDRLALLSKGAFLAVGPPAEVLTEANLTDALATDVRVFAREGELFVVARSSNSQ